MLIEETERVITVNSHEDLEIIAANDAFIKKCETTIIKIEDVKYGFKFRNEYSSGHYGVDVINIDMTYYSDLEKSVMGANYIVPNIKRAVEIILGHMLIRGTSLDAHSGCQLPDDTPSFRNIIDTFRKNKEGGAQV